MGVDLRRGAIQKDDASQVAVVAPPGSRVDQRVLPADEMPTASEDKLLYQTNTGGETRLSGSLTCQLETKHLTTGARTN